MVRALLVLLLLLPLPALAQQVALGALAPDPEAPVEVAAETLEVDQETGSAVFGGGVAVSQGGLRLAAEEVEVVYAAATGRIARLLARGGVTLAAPDAAAEAREAIYDIDAGTLLLVGDVLLTQGGNALAAERMAVDLAAGTARLEGGVRTILSPGAGP